MSDRQIFKAALVSTPECLSLQQLETLASGQTQAPPHLLQCPRCQAELALLKSFESNAPLPGEGAAVAWISSELDRNLDRIKNPSRSADLRSVKSLPASWLARWFGSRNVGFAVLATACAVIAITSFIVLRPGKEPELRAAIDNTQPVYRSEQIQVVAPVGDVRQVPKTLAWRGFPGASTYRVELMEVDKSVLWTTATKDNSVTIADQARARIVAGKPILWQVTALGPEGKVLATSSTQRFLFREHAGSDDPLLPQ